MAFGPVVIKPTSRGRVMLRSPMSLAKPRVVCNFLTTEEDRASMVAGAATGAPDSRAARAQERWSDQPFLVPESDSG